MLLFSKGNNSMERLGNTFNEANAHIIKGLLLNEGIKSNVAPWGSLQGRAPGPFALYVERQDVDKAMSILKESGFWKE